MSTFNYAEVIADAVELLAEFGRSVTLVELGDVPADSAKPWRGNTTLRSAPKQTLVLDVCFVEPSSLDALGRDDATVDFVKRAQQIGICYAEVPLQVFDELIDSDGSIWKVTGLSTLKPGDSIVLYFLGLSR